MQVTGNAVSPCPRHFNCACLSGIFILILTVFANVLCSQAQAKKPGERHCYRKFCVEVLTVKELEQILGKTVKLNASHYDDPSVDPFNRGTFTSNGERFVADDPTRTASANFPDGTELLLRNPANGRVSHVRVNDFGPFWVNRDLDVTRRVAEDLDFVKKGVTELEVTIVAPPRKEDMRYRRDREPIPTLGHLGVRSAEETVKLARILLQRLPAAQQKIIFAPDRLRMENVPTMVKRETVFHYVPEQLASPRAVGAETFSQSQQESARQALLAWRAQRLARRANQFHAFAWSSALLIALLIGPITTAGFAYIELHRHLLALLGWRDYRDLGAVFQGNPQSDPAVNECKTIVMRHEMMQRHSLDFDETYSWPQRPVMFGAARPPPDRTGLTFDADYAWPHNASDDASSGKLNDDMPAHERLRQHLDKIRQTFAARPKRRP